MPWNDNPEVREIASYAKKFRHDLVIAFVIDLSSKKVGYVSYGRSANLCAKAKIIGDAILDKAEIVEQALKG